MKLTQLTWNITNEEKAHKQKQKGMHTFKRNSLHYTFSYVEYIWGWDLEIDWSGGSIIISAQSNSQYWFMDHGSFCGFFSSQRGLGQGDPISPFFFILDMEGLNFMVKQAKANKWISGFKVNERIDNCWEIFHLQYADDTPCFPWSDKNQLRMLIVIFILFEVALVYTLSETKVLLTQLMIHLRSNPW